MINNEISIYSGGECTIENVVLQVSRVMKAFPSLPATFYELLSERIKELEIPDQRLTDSVNNLIDNFHYPVPTIAEIIGFDKKIKLYSYREMCKIAESNPNVFDKYEKIKIGNKIYWKE